MQKEIWKDIPGYDGLYQININGIVRKKLKDKRKRRGEWRYLTGSLYNNGYIYFKLNNNKRHSQHTLIAMLFIPNPENKQCINHKNGIRTDNRIENLEWCTHSENLKHAYDILGYKQSDETKNKRAKKLYKKLIDNNTGIIYSSVKEYSKTTGIRYNTIVSKLNGYMKNDLNIEYI